MILEMSLAFALIGPVRLGLLLYLTGRCVGVYAESFVVVLMLHLACVCSLAAARAVKEGGVAWR